MFEKMLEKRIEHRQVFGGCGENLSKVYCNG